MLSRLWMPSPNYSSRGGALVRLLVIHTAEGSRSVESLGSYFASPAVGVSSHVGADDKLSTVGEYVNRSHKAWTQGNANAVAVGIELCGFAAWDAAEWSRHPNMLDNCAQWLAEEASAFALPIVKLTPEQAQSSGRGVCFHSDLGSWGGGHTDPGAGFPIDQVLTMAVGALPVPPSQAPTPSAPPWPGVYLRNYTEHPSARTWQEQMRNRGWGIMVDGKYGDQSEGICRQFQGEKGLTVDGVVGPQTWDATFTAPVT